ncbi:MAG TPA: hypothetical protein DCM86_15570 [Verrucomicrobiales bacterium]|nr:hypothetical protein [Verrucomicrobiales bacterium]
MNKSVIAALVGLGIAAGADAATLGTPRTIYLTGATAFRGVEFDTLNNNIISDAANGITKEVVGTGSSAAYSFYGEWNGTGGPYVIRVYAAYSGSIEGQRDLLLGNLNTYSKLTQTDNLGVAGTFTHVATMSFSDSFQNTTAYGTAFGYPALNGNTVAVQPFVFVMNQAAYNAGIRNMTDQAFRLLATARREPSFFIGNGDFNSVVALSGRNDLSGTRTVTFAETGFGVFNKAQHWGNGVITGVYPTTTRGADNTVAPFTVALPFNDGWSSGGNVRADMNNSACTDAFVGYLSAGDARSLKGIDGVAGTSAAPGDAATWYLTYNGVPYTANNVINGAYTLWGYEHMYRKAAPANDVDADTFAPAFIAAIDTQLVTVLGADTIPAGLPLSAFSTSLIQRTAEATGTTSGPVQ